MASSEGKGGKSQCLASVKLGEKRVNLPRKLALPQLSVPVGDTSIDSVGGI